ncbi:hypothetical protein AABB24_012464 [Solanum stoloniferum]|uniref:Chlorophyll(Ide) b reductase NYC1, chloroplastic n=1 Tax=Solanum stoloniferum TaxID=62892 RepID=A0ABD2U312_9SOLN
MDMVAKVHVSTLDCHRLLPTGNVFRPLIGRRVVVQPCRSFKSEDVGPAEYVKVNKFVGAIRSAVWSCSKPSLRTENKLREAMEMLEERLFSLALYVGRYIITMMSTGVVMFVGFQLSGGDSQMNELIWYSWLGGIIIGTMIGSNLVLDEVARAGPRNVLITGSTRGLGKALAREFLLSGDRVIVTSRRQPCVCRFDYRGA